MTTIRRRRRTTPGGGNTCWLRRVGVSRGHGLLTESEGKQKSVERSFFVSGGGGYNSPCMERVLGGSCVTRREHHPATKGVHRMSCLAVGVCMFEHPTVASKRKEEIDRQTKIQMHSLVCRARAHQFCYERMAWCVIDSGREKRPGEIRRKAPLPLAALAPPPAR